MKARSDFVSNSSSSSFIIADYKDSFVSKFDLSKQDFIDAILDLMDIKDHQDEYIAKHKVDKWNGFPFYVLDKSIVEDKKQIINGHCDYLSSWNCWRLRKIEHEDRYVLSEGEHLSQYEQAYEVLKAVYNLPYSYDFNDESHNICSIYNRKLDKYVHKRIPSHVKKVIIDLHNHCGVLSNLDVLNLPVARFLFHFEDNDIWSLKGTNEPGKNEEKFTSGSEYAKEYNEKIEKSIWETESQSIRRIYEVLFKWFKGHGKLKGLKKDDNWSLLYDDVIAATMHEG